MNIITLTIGIMLNMNHIDYTESYHHVSNNSEIYYYIELFNGKDYVTLEYVDKELWYRDIDIINSSKKRGYCIDMLPGIPQICNGVNNIRRK